MSANPRLWLPLFASFATACASQPVEPRDRIARKRQPAACCVVAAAAVIAVACGGEAGPSSRQSARAQHLLLVTIDTLRADRVGAYGYVPAQTPAFDRVAREGVRFTHAFTTAPITLPAHASMLTGRYPPGHSARHNGLAMSASVPTLATTLQQAGFSTGAFVSAFPLDKRFGLARGFDVYDDDLPRGADRKPLNERAGDETVRRAVQWLASRDAQQRIFAWVHLFEPHAPYGDANSGRNVSARYDDEVAAADRSVARMLEALGARADSTLVVLAADHGEAFGEHGEIGHSIFVYDTTLQVPLVIKGPGVPARREVTVPVSLVDVAPTVLPLLGVTGFDADGVSLSASFESNSALADRVIYAESFAPLLDFGWSPLRSVRETTWKYIAAPRPELYEVESDPGESADLVAREPQRAARLLSRVESFSSAESPSAPSDSEAINRLRSLGYLGSGPRSAGETRPDPKDRIQVASRLAEVTSGEVQGDTLRRRLEAILRDDPDNPQAHLRLGYAEIERGRCDRAEPHLQKALAARIPSADAGLGLADCRGRSNDFDGASRALEAARELEPGNPVVEANLGLLALAQNDTAGAIRWLESALQLDSNLHEARFALARAFGRAGRRAEAASQAQTLLGQLPPDAPQRAEVQRLLEAVK